MRLLFPPFPARRRFAVTSHELLIEQVQHTGVESLNVLSSATVFKQRLNLNHPCKALIWTCAHPQMLKHVMSEDEDTKIYYREGRTASQSDVDTTSRMRFPSITLDAFDCSEYAGYDQATQNSGDGSDIVSERFSTAESTHAFLLRLYAKFPKSSSLIMRKLIKTCTVVSGPLQKIIPMSPGAGVYMIAYSDNANAVTLKNKLNTVHSKEYFCRLLENALNLTPNTLRITALLDFYWPVGTHYYTPINHARRSKFIRMAQHPMSNMFVVGEVVSDEQGWTEGALRSVVSVITNTFLQSIHTRVCDAQVM